MRYPAWNSAGLEVGAQPMKVWSPLLKHVVYPCLAETGYLGSRENKGVGVLTYHGVLPQGYNSIDPDLDGALVSAESFRHQLRWLKSRFHVISPADFLAWCKTRALLPPRSVLLTCDDGLLNTVTDMLPILREEEVFCLFFVTGASLEDQPSMLWYEELCLMLNTARPGHAGGLNSTGAVHSKTRNGDELRSLWWSLIRSLSQYEPQARAEFLERARVRLQLPPGWKTRFTEEAPYQRRFLTLTASQLRHLVEAGMAVGAHTLGHRMLSQLPQPIAWKEIAEARRALESIVGAPVWGLAYPFGNADSVSQREIAMAERAGYQCAFLNAGGTFTDTIPLFAVPRVHVTGKMSLAEFQAHLSGFHQVLRRHFAGSGALAAALGG